MALSTLNKQVAELDLLPSELYKVIDDVVHYYSEYLVSMDDGAYLNFIKSTNRYLELVGPLRYVKGLPSLLGNKVVLSLWDARVDPEELKQILYTIAVLRYTGRGFEELRYIVRKLYENVAEDDDLNLEILAKTPEEAISLALTIFVLASNP